MTHHNTKIWFNGKKGAAACAGVTVYDNSAIVATVEDDKATERQFVNALKAEYPDRVFVFDQSRGYFYVRSQDGAQ